MVLVLGMEMVMVMVTVMVMVMVTSREAATTLQLMCHPMNCRLMDLDDET